MHLNKILTGSLILLLLAASCRPIKDVFTEQNPRDTYVEAVQKSPLAGKELVRAWMAAGDSVLAQPVPIEMPSRAELVYFSDAANAWAWKVELGEGRTFRAHLAAPDTAHQIFMELFTVDGAGQPALETSTTDSVISYTMERSQPLILRVQAELLVDGSATLTMTDDPSMAFPVQGAIRADIGSFWGDPRDGGRRQHEGVDIFADRGTPALAVADGRVTRTGNGGLGGKTVWLRARGKAIYYAHLDSINTHMGQGVSAGDTLGFVGNTGNARTTPPHLHFGIYDRGATNPLPYIDFANDRPEPVAADPRSFNKWGRVAAARANIRPLPSTERPPLTSLSRGNPVRVLAGIGEWYQVALPGGQRGFAHRSLLEPADRPIGRRTIAARDSLFAAFTDNRPFHRADSSLAVPLYGGLEGRQLVRYRGKWSWIDDEG